MLTPKLSCICVFLKRLLSTTSGMAPMRRSIAMRIWRVDSSRISEMPSSFFSRQSSCMRSYMTRLFTMYGISSTTMRVRPLPNSSRCVLARISTRPRPVR